MKAVQKGFTLIELMIVVAIIGILAAIALPAYQDYTIRSQVSEGPSLAEGLKTAVSDYYATTGNWPVDATGAPPASLGYTSLPQGTYVSQIDVNNGGLVITYSSTAAKAHQNIDTKTLALSPIVSPNGDIAWVCGLAADPFADAAPAPATRGTTDVDPKYLPSSCKT